MTRARWDVFFRRPLVGSLLIASSLFSACSDSYTLRSSTSERGALADAGVSPSSASLSSGRVESLEPFASEHTGATYPIEVYFPRQYDDDSAETFPVIYATDAQWAFDGYASELDARGLPVVLVGIHDAGERETDFLLPGARPYFKFLTEELLPWVEEQVRVDTTQRTLLGTSYGGVMVVCSLLLDDEEEPHFTNYLAFDGSFYEHPTETSGLIEQRFSESSRLEATLLLTRATRAPSNLAVVLSFTEEMEEQAFEGLNLITHPLAVDHYAVSDPSFRFVLDTLF